MNFMIADVRVLSQQLSQPSFVHPKDLVSWMGAIQAQDCNMAKWAIGIRLKSATLREVESALQRGEILRTHVMRPTWHFVAAEDIRWMLKLSAQRLKSANTSLGKHSGIPELLYARCNRLIEKMLEGNKSLTREEIGVELGKSGVTVDSSLMIRFMMRAEIEGIVCSGVDKGNKPTYALLEERVAPARELLKEEALATLALRYFRSHSPASLQDFVWWSGLTITEARLAVSLIKSELVDDRSAIGDFFVYESWGQGVGTADGVHLLPAFDEYLISYKDRAAILEVEHRPKAFNRWGTFYPVILSAGRVVGNWNKSVRRGRMVIERSFFDREMEVNPEWIEKAEGRYRCFHEMED